MLSIRELGPHIRNFDEAMSEAGSEFLLTVLEKQGHQIFLVGTRHTRNPSDPQVLALEAAFKKSLKERERKLILCLEGTIPSGSDELLNKAVSRSGEQAVLMDIAVKEEMKALSIEPSFGRINALAIEVFPERRALAGWALLNFLSGLAKDGKIGIEKKELLIKVLGSISSQYEIAESGLACFEALRDYLEESGIINFSNFDQMFESDIDIRRVVEAQKPTNGPYITNKAAVYINLARDFGLMENTLRIFDETEQDLFVWQGMNHVVSQLPAYKYLGFEEIK
jgi:hypothetical protein